MTPHYCDESVQLYLSDCIEMLRSLPEASVDSCVTDPPYALEFMGKGWDSFDAHEDAGFCFWLSGLIDGEGCFTVKAHTRGTYAPAFSLKMRADEEGTLRIIQRILGIGTLSREENEPHPTVRWTVGDKGGCQRIVDLLDKYPLRAKKRLDFDIWREAVCEWTERPRGNRWHGAADNSRMVAIRQRLMDGRVYSDIAWSGHHFQDWCRLWGQEVFRVLKPGAHILSCGGTRTYHRLVAGLEDAGFEVRDCLAWIYCSGFPKSLNIGDGLGTALKPAHEPIVLARKPFKGTIKSNIDRHSTGALNIDACRIQYASEDDKAAAAAAVAARRTSHVGLAGTQTFARTGDIEDSIARYIGRIDSGRWPANIVLDDLAAMVLDEQSGTSGGGDGIAVPSIRKGGISTDLAMTMGNTTAYSDVGGASRFFYCAKPSRAERDYGCDGLRPRSGGEATDRTDGSAGQLNPRAGAGRTGGARNFHPTVKPIELMRWLVRLVTPVGGVCVDPFMGSGTTGMACRYEQRRFIGSEKEAEYMQIAARRIRAVTPLFNEPTIASTTAPRVAEAQQTLFD